MKARKVARKKPRPAKLDYEVLDRIVDRAFYMALQMIDIANHKRGAVDKGEPKVGGHPSACGSSKHILGAIHLVTREAPDYFACKPHVSPMDHAYNFLLHNFREKDGSEMPLERRKLAMSHLRHYSPEGEPVFQSYHAEADPDSYRYFPSGSVGIPPVQALYTALGYEFARDHGFEFDEEPFFWCLMGDSEFREGSLMEAMPDAGERQLGRVIWIVDYNRQNLDGIRVYNEKAFRGSDADRIAVVARANGWDAEVLKHGKKRERLFKTPGGDEFKRVLDEELTEFEFQGLLQTNDEKTIREHLGKKSDKLKKWLKNLDDGELMAAYCNLGGHCLETLVEAFERAKKDPTRPSMIVPYTIKGHGLRCQALSGNHSALPDPDELVEMAKRLGADNDDPFGEFPKNSEEENFLSERRTGLVPDIDALIQARDERFAKYQAEAKAIPWPVDFDITALKLSPNAHTQWMWGQVAAKLDRLARGSEAEHAQMSTTDKAWAKVAKFFMTMAPDVGSSTNTSPNMNGKLYGDIGQEDFEKVFDTKDKKAPDVVPHTNQRTGHLRFEIAEGNCMSAAGSIGKFGYFLGIPFFPAMTIYDFFIKRALDQFYYNVYWHSSFACIGTPSGVTLAPEGAQHSWKSDIQMPNCVTWEPFFAKELEWILADTLRRHFTGEHEGRETALIRGVTKGVVQKELLGRLKQQTKFEGAEEAAILETLRQDVLNGGYCLIDHRGKEDYTPGDNVVHIFAMGALGAEAMKASDALLEKGIYGNVFIVTSQDLLLGNFAETDGYRQLKGALGVTGDLFLTKAENQGEWYSLQGARVPIVSVHDGEPGMLDNLGSVVGVRQKALAIRKTSKSGTTAAIFHLHGIDAEGIVAGAEEVLKETAEERIQLNASLIDSLKN